MRLLCDTLYIYLYINPSSEDYFCTVEVSQRMKYTTLAGVLFIGLALLHAGKTMYLFVKSSDIVPMQYILIRLCRAERWYGMAM